MTPRICPNCREKIPIDSGFCFDEEFNLICNICKKIAFSASAIKIASGHRKMDIEDCLMLGEDKWHRKDS